MPGSSFLPSALRFLDREHSLKIAGFQIMLDLKCAAQWHMKKSALITKRRWQINSSGGKKGGPMMVMGFTTGRKYLQSPLDHYPLFSLLVHDDDVADGATLGDLLPYVRLEDSLLSEDTGVGVKLLCPSEPNGYVCLERERKDGPMPEFPTCFRAKKQQPPPPGAKKSQPPEKDEL